MIKIKHGALVSADHAYLETTGSTADKVEAAIWAYLWACENIEEIDDITYWPSLNQLRAAMRARRKP